MHKGTLNQELAELLNMNRRFFTYRSEIASGIKLNCKIWVGIYFLSRFMQICAVMHVWALVKQPIENHSICQLLSEFAYLIVFWRTFFIEIHQGVETFMFIAAITFLFHIWR